MASRTNRVDSLNASLISAMQGVLRVEGFSPKNNTKIFPKGLRLYLT